MAFYSITYDLKDAYYNDLYESLRKISNGAWCRPTESQWIIHSQLSAKEITAHLQRTVDKEDKILVLEINLKNYMQSNLDEESTTWLKRHTPHHAQP